MTVSPPTGPSPSKEGTTAVALPTADGRAHHSGGSEEISFDTLRLRAARSELGVRIVSGLIMAGGALALTLAGGLWFAVLVAAVAVAMCWEWGRLVREPGNHREFVLHLGAVLIALALTVQGSPLWGLLVLAVAAAVLYAWAPDRPLSAFGVAYVGIPTLLLEWLRQDLAYGLAAVLYLFLAVWITDIAAYASGRTFGGPKLAPRISPGKTWSGLAGGVACAALAGALFALCVTGASVWRLGALAAVLAVAAQIGDLYESTLKRRSGMKDASHLIPGHGGVLDRVDGLVTAVTLAVLIVLWANAGAAIGSLGPGSLARGLLLGG